MDTPVSSNPSRGLQYYMRSIHRVLGYLAVGMALVYSLSGIILIFRTTDFMKHSVNVETTVKPGLDADGLAGALKLKGIKVLEETDQVITFADGAYDKSTGAVSYVRKDVVEPFSKFINLHKMPAPKSPAVAVFTIAFGVILLLQAVTSLFMYKAASKRFRGNMLLTAIGVIAAVVLILVA